MTKKQVIKVTNRNQFIAIRDWYATKGRSFIDRPYMVATKYPTLIIEHGTIGLRLKPICDTSKYEVINFCDIQTQEEIKVNIKPRAPMESPKDVYPFVNMPLIVNNFTTLELSTPELRGKFKRKSTSQLPEKQLKQANEGLKEFLRQASEAANKG